MYIYMYNINNTQQAIGVWPRKNHKWVSHADEHLADQKLVMFQLAYMNEPTPVAHKAQFQQGFWRWDEERRENTWHAASYVQGLPHERVAQSHFVHHSSVPQMIQAIMDGGLNPSTVATCDNPQCGLGGVYLFEMGTLDEKDIAAAWKQGLGSGYNKGAMLVVKVVGGIVSSKANQQLQPGEIGTRAPNKNAHGKAGPRQFCTHPSTVEFVAAVFHESLLVDGLSTYMRRVIPEYSPNMHGSLRELRTWLERPTSEAGEPKTSEENLVELQNAMVTSASSNPHTVIPASVAPPPAKRQRHRPPAQSAKAPQSVAPQDTYGHAATPAMQFGTWPHPVVPRHNQWPQGPYYSGHSAPQAQGIPCPPCPPAHLPVHDGTYYNTWVPITNMHYRNDWQWPCAPPHAPPPQSPPYWQWNSPAPQAPPAAVPGKAMPPLAPCHTTAKQGPMHQPPMAPELRKELGAKAHERLEKHWAKMANKVDWKVDWYVENLPEAIRLDSKRRADSASSPGNNGSKKRMTSPSPTGTASTPNQAFMYIYIYMHYIMYKLNILYIYIHTYIYMYV